MDEAIWIAVGIIAVLIVLGIIANFFYQQNSSNLAQTRDTALDHLQSMCTNVCGMPADTYLSATVTLPAGVNLTTNLDNICISTSETNACRRCACNLQPYTLDLSNASVVFKEHDYRCYFLKSTGMITINCKG